MKKSMRGGLGALGLVAFSLMPALVRAEGTTCGTATAITPDGRITASTLPTATTFFFVVQTRMGNSYCVEFKNTSGAAPDVPGTVTASTTNLCNAFAGTRDTSAIDPVDTFNTNRLCWTATATDHRFSVARGGGATISYTFSAADTTMFSPAWSTNGSYATYYSFFNTTNSSITGTLTLTTSAGGAAGTTTLVVLPGQTAATNTVALGTPANQAGTAKFTHNGPPGAILVESDIANFALSTPYIQPVKFTATRDVR
jgi:hypothetical protein